MTRKRSLIPIVLLFFKAVFPKAVVMNKKILLHYAKTADSLKHVFIT